MITKDPVDFPNISIDDVSIIKSDGTVFNIYPRTDTAEYESHIFDNIIITEDMFAESILGTLEFYDSTFIMDQLNLSSFDNVFFTLDGTDYEFRITSINISGDLADKAIHGPSGTTNKVTIQFASDEFVYRNFDANFIDNFIGKISKSATEGSSSIGIEVPDGFDAGEYHKAEGEMPTIGFVQKIMSIEKMTSYSKKPLESHNTYNDIWVKTENFFYPFYKIGNNLRVSQVMNYICEYACYEENKHAANFFFWEDLKNWNFKCIEGLLAGTTNAKGSYNLSGMRGQDEHYQDTVVSMEVINDISPIKLFDSGCLFSEYVRVVPDWANPYRAFVDVGGGLKRTEISYNYKDDAKKWKHISPNDVVTDDVLENIRVLNDYGTNRISDLNYGFYSPPYNAKSSVWWNFYDFTNNWYIGDKMGLAEEDGGESIKKYSDYEKRPSVKEISRLENDYWQSQYDFSELPGAFLHTIYTKIKWPLSVARRDYAVAKTTQTQWDVYKNVICCDKISSSGSEIPEFFAFVYAADKIYGGNGITTSDGVTYANDPGGIYAYWWREVEIWPRSEVEGILDSSYEVVEFVNEKNSFPFVFVSSPTSLKGGYTAGVAIGYTGPDTRAYNLSEILNTTIPREFEDANEYVTLTMNPGVSTVLDIDDVDRKTYTSYPKKYQMMPVGNFRVISDTCPDFSQSGTQIPISKKEKNKAGMYYGGRIVQMKTLFADELQFIRGFTAEKRFPLKKQRPFIFVFDTDNTHDGLCTGDCV